MAKAPTKPGAVATVTDRAQRKAPQPAPVGDTDIARRAYDLYLGRGCEHGHDVDDWLQAEHELRGGVSRRTRARGRA
jgi:hypothetical protein